ncbi:sulfite reductase flavoprotein subunit alpha [Parafilimonas sp.]|uniref:diflavin oxidoreductase n=1 Tax=Parafilimonas sp. TaxID=1969739 RepID=UPI0039E24209
MLTEQKLKSFKTFIQDSSRDEIIWMSGFLAGISEKTAVAAPPPAEAAAAASTEKLVVSVLYGTETGNSKKIATKLASVLKNKQHKVTLKALDQYNTNNLEKETVLYVITSTHGDGEPPAAAKKFYDYLHAKQHSLPNLKFAVLALGDSSYPLFCKAGEDIDAKLKEAGALQLLPLEKSDLDFYPVSEAWISNVVNNLPTAENATAAKPLQPVEASKNTKRFYRGEVRTHINLNDRGSSKETWHIEISTNESIYYLPGDSLGIIPPNADEEVHEIVRLLNADKKQQVIYRNETFTLFNLFKTKLNILYLPLRIIDKYAKLIQAEVPAARLDLINLLSLYPLTGNVALENFIAILEPITPRLYSISSSPYAHGNNEIHITVGRDKFSADGKVKYGFCSSHFAGLNYGDEVIFYINSNDNFRLPQQEKDIIMIGPGTGIAPFRSFISHRDDEGAPGRNWLFFGDQHFASDFLYQSELLSFFDTGSLTRLNTAFSRDQKEKVYVQHRMLQQSKELYSWIKGGAHVYVCGCKSTMAKDVEAALIEIISREANIDTKAATAYLSRLEDDGRYAKDVY